MWERIRVILRKEFLQALREPRMRVLLFVPPMVQLVVFGFAVNLDVDRARIAWMDLDGTPVSRELRDRFTGSGRFEIVATPENEEQVQALLDRGDAQAVVGVLPGFARDLARGRTPQVQVLVDGSNSNTASIVSNYAGGVIADFSAEQLALRQSVMVMQRGAKSPVNVAAPDIQAASRVWFNPDLYSRNYFVPGVIANIIMMVTLMLTSLAIVREKEIGTMEQLMVTPVRPIELMLGKTLPFALVGLVDTAMVTAAAMLVFHVPLHGSFLLLLGCASLFLMTTLGAGLFISTISHTQQQAMMSSFFFSMPAFMLSGFAFPIRNMPEVVQWLTYLNPVRYFIEIVRGIFLKGSGASVLWPQMAALAAYGMAVVGLSAVRFHKKLD
ncbi:MAG: ABC transporter permease [Acidobacteria bacterium]|nr:ABC transporter permease [Acidobacteriota bacterium]